LATRGVFGGFVIRLGSGFLAKPAACARFDLKAVISRPSSAKAKVQPLDRSSRRVSIFGECLAGVAGEAARLDDRAIHALGPLEARDNLETLPLSVFVIRGDVLCRLSSDCFDALDELDRSERIRAPAGVAEFRLSIMPSAA
jgi:hypothetical protein